MDIEKIWSEIQELPNLVIKIGKKDCESIEKLDRLSRLLFSKSVQAGCSNCHTKAYIKLTNLTKQNLIDMGSKKYILKDGITVEYPVRSANFFNRETLTDENAIKFLKEVPSGVQYFESIPEANEDKELHKMNKEGLRAEYKAVFGEDAKEELTKAELLDALKAD